MKPGRNEPCPCGSGRKYKHCCESRANGEQESPQDAAWRRVRLALEDYTSMMLRFIADVYGRDAIHEAWAEFTLWEDDEPRLDPDTPHMQVFMPWFFHWWRPDPAGTAIEAVSLHDRSPTAVLLERRGRRLDPVLRRYLEGCLAAPFSFHEILRSDPGHGFRTRDVLTGEEHEVLERSASRTMEAGDILFGQLVTTDGITLLEACPIHAFGPEMKLGLIDLRERIATRRDLITRETLADWDFELREVYLALMDKLLHPSLPRLQNTDGEDFLHHRLEFDVDSAREAIDGLRHLAHDETEADLLDSAEYDAQGQLLRVSFGWTQAGNRAHRSWTNTVLGHITIDGNRLVAEVNSAERAARLKRIIEGSLGDRARHRNTETETIEDMRARASSDPQPSGVRDAQDPADLPEVRERITEIVAAHYEDWLNDAIPALDGLTPLEAVKENAGREKVEALIMQLERHGRRMHPPLDPAVPRRLRERLGLI